MQEKKAEFLNDHNTGIICRELNVCPADIKNVTGLKSGMTNHSFLFSVYNKKYIMRIPGEGTEHLIDRANESDVYKVLKGNGICDHVVYMNSETGYKISEFVENSRVCNSKMWDDVTQCMMALRRFHNLDLKVGHIFDLKRQITFYEELWGGRKSRYHNYNETKRKILELFDYVDAQEKHWTLCHIDSVPDNFLFTTDNNIYLIDWEYAGMQDADVDIAMFAIYSFYDRSKVDKLIATYYEDNCAWSKRLKIYCYIAICGLLWSNWCEYKQQKGVEFGEYSLRQYRYAEDYYKIFQEEIMRK